MPTRRYQPIKAYAWVRMTCISSVSWIEAHHDKEGSIPVKLFTSSIALLTLAFPARAAWANADVKGAEDITRSEEHTSELQSLMRISYAVFCLKKKTQKTHYQAIVSRKNR